MEAEEILRTAETIRKQLVHTSDMNVLMSWGISHLVATTKNGMATLKFDVRGRIHQGSVLIAYDEGGDVYQIFLRSVDKADICIAEEAYCDNMVQIIDRAIEVGDNAEEYSQFCEQEFKKLMRGEFC